MTRSTRLALILLLAAVLRPSGKDAWGTQEAGAPGELSERDAAVHVLNRLGYGSRPGDVERVLEIAFADVGGWDTHVNQGGAQGQLATRLRDFADSITAFCSDLGDRMEDVLVLTMSEFGRTARENGNAGTDHGHANCLFAIGGAVDGGAIRGVWPGLEREQLYEGRDLALTNDFRNIFAEVLVGHLGIENAEAVFPHYHIDRSRFVGLFV